MEIQKPEEISLIIFSQAILLNIIIKGIKIYKIIILIPSCFLIIGKRGISNINYPTSQVGTPTSNLTRFSKNINYPHFKPKHSHLKTNSEQFFNSFHYFNFLHSNLPFHFLHSKPIASREIAYFIGFFFAIHVDFELDIMIFDG